MNTNEIIKPVANLHGTNSDSLREDYINAMNKVGQAIEFTAYNIEFNARDYANVNEFQKAKAQRIEMLQKMNEVFLYLEEIASSI